MKTWDQGYGYNERLFSSGIRRKLHYARFKWIREQFAKRNRPAESVLELGCFDGKLIDFLSSKPKRYVGFDANWEGGLDIAKTRWSGQEGFAFVEAASPAEMHLSAADTFDVAVVMETLEHVPPELVDGYLRKISEHLNGYLFITVPNEKGLLFLAKWAAKKLLRGDSDQYSLSELLNATLGRMNRVARREHKGFDYRVLVENVARHFELIEVSGHPLQVLPASLCFGIGIVAKTKVEKGSTACECARAGRALSFGPSV